MFCFERYDEAGMCSGMYLGSANTSEECCLLPGSGGMGAGAYATGISGTENCFNCMNVIGELDAQMYGVLILLYIAIYLKNNYYT